MMKRMIVAISLLAFMFITASFLSAPVSSVQEAVAQDDTTIMIKDTCTSCHGLARTCNNLDKDEVWWTSTLERMAGRGASIDTAQVATLSTFLTSPSEDMLKACGK